MLSIPPFVVYLVFTKYFPKEMNKFLKRPITFLERQSWSAELLVQVCPVSMFSSHWIVPLESNFRFNKKISFFFIIFSNCSFTQRIFFCTDEGGNPINLCLVQRIISVHDCVHVYAGRGCHVVLAT